MGRASDIIETEEKQAVFREPRIRKLVKIMLFTEDSGPHDSIVRNLSTFGVRATAPVILESGQSITIQKDGFGRVSGTVRWIGGGEFGMQFDEAINIDQFNFGSQNDRGHFLKKIDNGHVWNGFQTAVSNKRPGFRIRKPA